MKQSISGPVAAIAIVLALAGALVIFNRETLAPEPEAPVILPPTPPVNEQEVSRLRRNLAPLGISPVWPPLGDDRFKVVRVAWVMRASPADLSGMRPGDAVKSFNGVKTPHPYNLISALSEV
ncbi:MAG: hypothetical protein GTN78_11300, partial [Gemmatimonadales bacterium]|nr:hypothetical protein [Gemmatimonadales bacterium]